MAVYWKKWRFGQVLYPSLTDSQTTEYRAAQFVSSLKFKKLISLRQEQDPATVLKSKLQSNVIMTCVAVPSGHHCHGWFRRRQPVSGLTDLKEVERQISASVSFCNFPLNLLLNRFHKFISGVLYTGKRHYDWLRLPSMSVGRCIWKFCRTKTCDK